MIEASGDILGRARWAGGDRRRHQPQEVLASLVDAFRFVEEDLPRGVRGLRPPQLGGLHAILAYWTTQNADPATVVMPTATGKTETMMAVFAATRPELILVLVPSDALRDQIASKFESFGVLQPFGVVSPSSLRPVVGQVRHGFATADEALEFAAAASVIVTTPSALDASKPEARSALIESCSHLFVDEAHHVRASTWQRVRDEFAGKPVVQFTATPFREDGRHLGGRIIYNFPLQEAQRQKYFSQINFISVLDLDNHDEAMATRAVQQLREDIHAGLDHLIMVRVKQISRVGDVLSIYKRLAPDFNPVALYSTQKKNEARAARSAMATRRTRVIVCVDMLGEGFDEPSLKIAAIHDPHKSLGVTLQFVGRFARTVGGYLGDATVVVGRPERRISPLLRQLYSEDSDWNKVIRDLSEGAVAEKEAASEFEAGFGSLPDDVTLRSLLPAMSTVVYRTNVVDWDPLSATEVYPEDKLLTVPIAVNQKAQVAWFVTENRNEVKWGELRTVEEVSYDLYVMYWDRQRQLLFINGSNTNSHYQELARAVAGASAERVTGEVVYRVMADMTRLVPTNVGLLDVRNRSRRFTMHVGADVTEGLPLTEAQTKSQTNIFAYGYDDGERSGIGASLKGRIWSHRVANTLNEWTAWCDHVGDKLLDSTIKVDEVMKNFIRPVVVTDRPKLVPLAIEWPWQVYLNMSDHFCVQKADTSLPIVDVDLVIRDHKNTGPIAFDIVSSGWTVQCSVTLVNGEMNFVVDCDDAFVVTTRTSTPLEEFLNTSGLQIQFEQEAVVSPSCLLLKPDRTMPPFERARLKVVDWTGIKLDIESQGGARRQDSVQARMIKHVLTLADWDFVLDDDGTGEVADIVAMRADQHALYVHITHCKFVHGGKPLARVQDLYEVCGQAQKSVVWRRRSLETIFDYLVRREKQRLKRGAPSGFMKGDASALYSVADVAHLRRPDFTVAIAQPGLSAAKSTTPQLELLASTDTYLVDTTTNSLEVYCSP
jgi:superfamily II DNA or RNA helicase